MPLVEKEVIRPGTYFYRDEQTGSPRKLVVTPELCRYWHEQGNAMLSAGLTVPVPCEHDFDAHPMTPAEKLKGNAGWVKGYSLKGDALFSSVDITDADIHKRLPTTIRWTSPWINSFTDGAGKEWKNVISHLALTTRPRIINQQPFGSVAAALSIATMTRVSPTISAPVQGGFCLSRAGRLVRRRTSKRVVPLYPIAFSLMSGAALGDGDMPSPKKSKKPGDKAVPPAPTEDLEEMDGGEVDEGVPGVEMDDDPTNDGMVDLEPFNDPAGDVGMEELLSDLLGALGIHVEHGGGEEQFKRALYNAAMTKIHELAGKGDANQQPNRTNPPGQPPNNPKPGAPGQANPLVQQEQQPMYMSLEEIQKLPDPLRGVAMGMYNENVKLRGEMEASKRVTDSLRDAKLKEAATARQQRAYLLGRLSPRVKADLDAMLALPGMALSMGDGGAVVDPMAQTLAVLEKGLADMPRLLTTDTSALSVHPQPTDGEMSQEVIDATADSMARMMGCPPEPKQAG